MYWITVNGQVDATREQRKLSQVISGLQGYVYDGMIIRVSSINDDANAAMHLEMDFVRALYQAMPRAARLQFFGKGVAA